MRGLPDARVMPSLSPLSHRAPKLPLPVEWNSTHVHKKDYQSCISVFPSTLLSAVRTCQGIEDFVFNCRVFKFKRTCSW